MKFHFIQLQEGYPVTALCQIMQVSRSVYYAWCQCPAKLITAETLHLYRRAKEIFTAIRQSLGTRELSKKLRAEGFEIGREATRTLMKRLKLVVKQRQAGKVTTQVKHGDSVADYLLNKNFNPASANEVLAGDITYLKTGEGWLYLAIVMDLYSRRIIGWAINRRLTQDLVSRALIQAYNLRRPSRGLVFHSDRGSQHTSKHYRLLTGYGIRALMGDVGACWDNAVVERFW